MALYMVYPFFPMDVVYILHPMVALYLFHFYFRMLWKTITNMCVCDTCVHACIHVYMHAHVFACAHACKCVFSMKKHRELQKFLIDNGNSLI